MLKLLLSLTITLLSTFKTSFRTPVPVKTIYLTFDDGPLDGSEMIDSVALAEKLRFNVFLVGAHVMQSPQLKNYFGLYEQNPYIESYNHSFTHANDQYARYYQDPAGVLADIQKNETLLHLRFHIVRLPGRNMWRIGSRKRDDGVSGSLAADLLASKGYKLFGWDLEWQHKSSDGTPIQSVNQILQETDRLLNDGKTFTKDHLVILLHDEMFRKKWEESELKSFVDSLRKRQGYVLEHIRFYPAQ